MNNKKLIKRLLIILGAFVVVLTITFSIFTSLYEEKIGKKIVSEINKNITSELTIQDFGFSVFRSFPNLGADLKGVQLTDNKDGILLEAQTISFRVGLFSLLKGDIAAKSLLIEDGALTIKVSKSGWANYDIFKEDSKAEGNANSGASSKISIKKAILKDMEIFYEDAAAKQEVMFTINKVALAGQFSSSQFSLTSNADIVSNFIEQDGHRFLAGKSIVYDAKISVDMDRSFYQLDDVRLEVESNIFDVKGSIQQKKKESVYDLVFTGTDVSLKSMSEMLPREYLKRMGNLKSRGQVLVNASVKGVSSKKKNPKIIADLSLNDGRLSSDKMTGKLKDVSFKAHFDNGKKQRNSSAVFSIDGFKGYYNKELLEFDFELKNLDDPSLDFEMDGVIPMQMVYGFMNDDRISDGDGEVEINNLKLKGKLSDMTSMHKVGRVKMSGMIEFDDASLTIKKEEVTLDRGRLIFKNNELKVDKLKFEGAGSDIRFDGVVNNFVPVLFSDSLNSNRANLEFDAKLSANSLDIDRLMNLSLVSSDDVGSPKVDSLSKVRTEKREKITDYLKGKFRATIKAFNYDKIDGKDFVGNIDFAKKEMMIDGRAEAMNGIVKLDGKMNFKGTPYLKTKVVCRNIDAKEFFRQSNNFGQEVLTDQHLKGLLNTRMVIESSWDENGNFLMDKLHVLSELTIKEGMLQNFDLLKDMSAIVKVKDLQKIKFSELRNYLEVKDNRIIIPVMYIQNNAMNLTFSGDHTFDNDIEYYLKVNAGRAMIDKFKAHNSSLSPKKSSKNGLFNIYLKFTGNIDNIKYATAKRDVKREFEYSEIRKDRIRKKLEKAFGDIEVEPVVAFPVSATPEMNPVDDGSEDEDDGEFLDWEKEGGN